MNVTKRAKTVTVERHSHIQKIRVVHSEYVCPSCRERVVCLMPETVVRFRCECGQELIVKEGAVSHEDSCRKTYKNGTYFNRERV